MSAFLGLPVPALPLLRGEDNLDEWKGIVIQTFLALDMLEYLLTSEQCFYRPTMSSKKALGVILLTTSIAPVRNQLANAGWDFTKVNQNPRDLYDLILRVFSPEPEDDESLTLLRELGQLNAPEFSTLRLLHQRVRFLENRLRDLGIEISYNAVLGFGIAAMKDLHPVLYRLLVDEWNTRGMLWWTFCRSLDAVDFNPNLLLDKDITTVHGLIRGAESQSPPCSPRPKSKKSPNQSSQTKSEPGGNTQRPGIAKYPLVSFETDPRDSGGLLSDDKSDDNKTRHIEANGDDGDIVTEPTTSDSNLSKSTVPLDQPWSSTPAPLVPLLEHKDSATVPLSPVSPQQDPKKLPEPKKTPESNDPSPAGIQVESPRDDAGLKGKPVESLTVLDTPLEVLHDSMPQRLLPPSVFNHSVFRDTKWKETLSSSSPLSKPLKSPVGKPAPTKKDFKRESPTTKWIPSVPFTFAPIALTTDSKEASSTLRFPSPPKWPGSTSDSLGPSGGLLDNKPKTPEELEAVDPLTKQRLIGTNQVALSLTFYSGSHDVSRKDCTCGACRTYFQLSRDVHEICAMAHILNDICGCPQFDTKSDVWKTWMKWFDMSRLEDNTDKDGASRKEPSKNTSDSGDVGLDMKKDDVAGVAGGQKVDLKDNEGGAGFV